MEKEKVEIGEISNQVKYLSNDKALYPRFLDNIAEYTENFWDSIVVECKRVHTMAWVLLNFVSQFGTPRIST